MGYVRKTVDEYHVEGNYGYGWEAVTYEDNYMDAVEMMKCYRENEKGIPFRVIKHRVMREVLNEIEQH